LIEASIKVFDKVLLILSEDSVNSEWVEREVDIAIEKEKERHTAILFPVKLDEGLGTAQPSGLAISKNEGTSGTSSHGKNMTCTGKRSMCLCQI